MGVNGALKGISEQGTVISKFLEFFLVIIGDAVFTACPLLLLVQSVAIPHHKQRQQHPNVASETMTIRKHQKETHVILREAMIVSRPTWNRGGSKKIKEAHILRQFHQVMKYWQKMNLTHPPIFPNPLTIAMATPRLMSPPAFELNHARSTGIVGKTPMATSTVPK